MLQLNTSLTETEIKADNFVIAVRIQTRRKISIDGRRATATVLLMIAKLNNPAIHMIEINLRNIMFTMRQLILIETVLKINSGDQQMIKVTVRRESKLIPSIGLRIHVNDVLQKARKMPPQLSIVKEEKLPPKMKNRMMATERSTATAL